MLRFILFALLHLKEPLATNTTSEIFKANQGGAVYTEAFRISMDDS